MESAKRKPHVSTVRSGARRKAAQKQSASTAALDLAGRFRNWAEGMLSNAGTVARLAQTLSEARQRKPTEPAALEQAGKLLRAMREAVGISAKAAALAAKLRDPDLVEHAEGGKVALPFDAILRLASVLGDKDPMGAAGKLLRAYYPDAWKSLDMLRMGGFIMPGARERAVLDMYRKNKAARELSDDDFNDVVELTRTVFERLVDFRSEAESD